jgi:hypothetical protein
VTTIKLGMVHIIVNLDKLREPVDRFARSFSLIILPDRE